MAYVSSDKFIGGSLTSLLISTSRISGVRTPQAPQDTLHYTHSTEHSYVVLTWGLTSQYHGHQTLLYDTVRPAET